MKIASARQAEAQVERQIRENHLFTKIHGRPTRSKVRLLIDEANTAATSVNLDYYEWAQDYGLLQLVLGDERYTEVTGIDIDDDDTDIERPGKTHPDIDENTSDVERAELKAEHEAHQEAWFMLQGGIKGITANIREALNEKYYEQLQERLLGYKKVPIKKYFDHLHEVWCKLDTEEIKLMRQEYYRGWNHGGGEHITKFKRRLDEEARQLGEDGIKIRESDKLQHYMEEMYASKMFERHEYDHYEDLDPEDKTYGNATTYFEGVVAKMDTYDHNMQATAKRSKFESAAQVHEDDDRDSKADSKDDAAINEWLNQVSTSNETMLNLSTKTQEQMSAQNDQIQALLRQQEESARQIKALTEANAKLSKTLSTRSTDGGGGRGGGDGDRKMRNAERRKTEAYINCTRPGPLKIQCNLGGYCHTHGFDPVGRGHNSKTCKNQREGHDGNATRDDRRGGSTEFCPKNFKL